MLPRKKYHGLFRETWVEENYTDYEAFMKRRNKRHTHGLSMNNYLKYILFLGDFNIVWTSSLHCKSFWCINKIT